MSEMSTCTICKSLVIINWHHIMKKANKCMNKVCCMYSVNLLQMHTVWSKYAKFECSRVL